MNILSKIFETALITLKARAEEASKPSPLLRDEKGIELLEKLLPHLPKESRKRILDRRMPGSLNCHITRRGIKSDQ